MAVLPDADRQKIWRGLMRYWSRINEPTPFLKTDLLVAIGDLDDWVDANAISINNALPNPFKTSATTEQKAVLLSAIIAMRYTEEWLKRLVGEVT